GVGEPGGTLDGADGVRGAPRGADGQQHGRAGGARAGGRAEELLRQWGGVGGAVGGDAVLAAADALPVGAEPAGVADGLPDGVRRGGRRGARGPGTVLAVEPQRGAAPLLVAGRRRRGSGHLVSPPEGSPRRVTSALGSLARPGKAYARPRGNVR